MLVEKEVEKAVTQVVEKVVKETVIVEGTPQVIEKVVTSAPPTPAPPSAVEISLWGWWEPRMDIYAMAARRTEERHPDISIDMQSLPYDTLWQKVLPSSLAGTGPTPLKTKPVHHFEYLLYGVLEPYPEDIFYQNWWAEDLSDSYKSLKYEGRNYVFVDGISPTLML